MNNELNFLNNVWRTKAILATNANAINTLSSQYPYCSALQIIDGAYIFKSNHVKATKAIQKAKIYSGNLFLMHHAMHTVVIDHAKNVLNDIITPPFADNYFAFAKIETSTEEVADYIDEQKQKKLNAVAQPDADNSLMITMSFAEWLVYFKEKKKKEQKELESKQAMRAMWQKEKLTEAIGEENDVIPENVFKMAIDSMNLSESAASESLAEIMLKQGKTDKAIEMYRQLSLLNPQKSSYFASKIKNITNNI